MSIRTVQGLNDRHKAEQILYDLSKEQNFGYSRAKELMMCAYATWDSSDPFHGQTGHPGGITMEDRYPARESADHASIGAGIQAHDGSEHWNVPSTRPAVETLTLSALTGVFEAIMPPRDPNTLLTVPYNPLSYVRIINDSKYEHRDMS